MKSPRQNSDCWDQFWRTGRDSCCSEQEDSAHAQRIREQWVELFAGIESNNKVLDLCTGNGAVLRVALECLNRTGFPVALYGVDSAAIAPDPSDVDRAQAELMFVRASVTDLPFADGSFDVISSQFGIEYAPVDAAVPEIMRVLKRGGVGRFVTHASDGVLAAGAAAEIADIHSLMNEIRIFPAAIEALTLAREVERDPSGATASQVGRATQAHEAFQERLARIGDGWRKRSAISVYRDTGSILQHTYLNRRLFPVDVLLDKVRETEQSVNSHRDRLQSLLDSAFDRESCEQLVFECRRHGAREYEFRPVLASDDTSQLGWVITTSK